LTVEELSKRSGMKDTILLELADGSLDFLNQLIEKKDLVDSATKFLKADVITAYNIAEKVDGLSTEDQLLFLRILAHLIHRKYSEEKLDVYKLILDRLYLIMENLGKGLNLKLALIYIYLKGGEKVALYKGPFQGYEEDYTS